MNKKPTQNIAALVTLSGNDKALIMNGIRISLLFQKELLLVYNLKRKEKTQKRHIIQELNDFISLIQKDIPEQKCSALLLPGPVSAIPEILADDHETIMIIANSVKYKDYAKSAMHSPVPFLFINPGSELSEFRKIILPVDLRKECSDAALWSSYFGRLNRSSIIIIAAKHKGSYERKQVAKNIIAIKKLMQKFNITHKIYKGSRSSLYNSFEALEFAYSSNADMLVILGSSTVTPIDRIIGLPEKKLIRKAGMLPVLLINPRRKNYILCD